MRNRQRILNVYYYNKFVVLEIFYTKGRGKNGEWPIIRHDRNGNKW